MDGQRLPDGRSPVQNILLFVLHLFRQGATSTGTDTTTPHRTKARPAITPDRLFVLDDEAGHMPGGHD